MYIEQLTPELERKLAVEELWARRNVLAEIMNAERLKVYMARRALFVPPHFARMDVMWQETRDQRRPLISDRDMGTARTNRRLARVDLSPDRNDGLELCCATAGNTGLENPRLARALPRTPRRPNGFW